MEALAEEAKNLTGRERGTVIGMRDLRFVDSNSSQVSSFKYRYFIEQVL